MEQDKQEVIHKKGFRKDMTNYAKLKVGPKKLDDPTINLDALEFRKWYKMNNKLDYTNKHLLYQAVARKDYKTIMDFSHHYYEHNGIYRRAVDYLASLYRYDWYVVPHIIDESYGADKIKKEFIEMLDYLDGSYIKRNCELLAHNVLLNGIYYGYRLMLDDGIVLQELDPLYCRTRYSVGNLPVIEFNMRYFDDKFSDPEYRLRILNLFPKDFQKGYLAYKEGKLVADPYDTWGRWYPLDPKMTVVFYLSEDHIPWLLNAIPSIIDYEVAKDIDRRKQLQQLAKIIVQKLPIDKNGDLIFDIDEAADLHANAVDMLRNVVGADVFTTFADVDDIDLSDASEVNKESIKNSRNAVYDDMGITSNLFNSDGNLSVDKSSKIDAGSIHQLILQFEIFFNKIVLEKTSKPKKYKFRFHMLDTTQFNYIELAKLYKEEALNGYSKILPQIALGNSQSAILSNTKFENEILELPLVFVPSLLASSTGSEDLANLKQQRSAGSENKGRPTLPDDQKSDKTIQNIESAG